MDLVRDSGSTDKQRRGASIDTYFRLLAEFGVAHVPVDRVAPRYFGMTAAEAKGRALRQMLPCPVFRLREPRSPWLVSVIDLVALIDQRERSDTQEALGFRDAHDYCTARANRRG